MEGKKIGVIGSGYRIRDVLSYLLKANPSHTIVAVYDPSSKSLEQTKKILGSFSEMKSAEALLTSDVDWIFIGTFNSTHKDYIIEACNNGKHIFCEKPLAISLDECKKIKETIESSSSKFFISYPLIYSPHFSTLHKLVSENVIGKIISLEFNETLSLRHGSFIMTDWRRLTSLSGGHLLEKCCHDFTLVHLLVDSLPKKIVSFGGQDIFVKNNKDIYEKAHTEKYDYVFNGNQIPNPFINEKDVIDNQLVMLEYLNGVRAVFHTNCNSGLPERRMYICGTEGTIRADLIKGKIEVKKSYEKKVTVYYNPHDDSGHGGGDEILAFHLNQAMISDYDTNSLYDGIVSAVTCLMADESMKTGKIIDMVPVWKSLSIA